MHEFFNAQSGIRDDAAEGAGADLFVVGNNGTGVRFIPAQNHMTAGLATERETGAFQGGANFTAERSVGSLATQGVP